MTRGPKISLVCFVACAFLLSVSLRCFASDPYDLETTASINSASSESQPSDDSGAEVEPTPPSEGDEEPPLEEAPEPESPPQDDSSEPDTPPPTEELPEELPPPEKDEPPPIEPELPPSEDGVPPEDDSSGRSATTVDLNLYAEGLTEYEMLFHIRYCVIFFVFGLVPFTYGVWIVFLISRWVYQLCIRSV